MECVISLCASSFSVTQYDLFGFFFLSVFFYYVFILLSASVFRWFNNKVMSTCIRMRPQFWAVHLLHVHQISVFPFFFLSFLPPPPPQFFFFHVTQKIPGIVLIILYPKPHVAWKRWIIHTVCVCVCVCVEGGGYMLLIYFIFYLKPCEVQSAIWLQYVDWINLHNTDALDEVQTWPLMCTVYICGWGGTVAKWGAGIACW